MTVEARPVIAVLELEYTPSESESVPPKSIDSDGKVREQYSLLDGTSMRFGRAKTNDIVVSDRDISRFHATFAASVSGLVLSDLSSTNGTFVNGKRISTPVDLKSNDVITMGKAKLTVQLIFAQDPSVDEDACTKLAELQATEVTVLLVDVVRYTTMSQALPPDDVAGMLRTWFELAAPIVAAHEGEIDKYIGDCVMALWRNPKQKSSHLAQQAAKAAAEIVHKTDELAASGAWPHNDRYRWRCRAALNSGVALVGTVGAGSKRNYTVLGDTINVTFRIETVAGKLDQNIILSQSTADLLGSAAQLKALGAHDLDGRSGEVALYSLEAI